MASLDVVRDRAGLTGRIGLAARGTVYGLAGLIALFVAADRGGGEVEGQGALRALADQPFGRPLLMAMAAGLLAYAVWRLLRALTGAAEGGNRDGWRGPVKRLGDLGQAAAYASLFAATIRLLTRGSTGDGSDEQARSISARLFDHAWGRAVGVAAGIALLGAAAGLAWWGLSRRFEEHLRTSGLSTDQRRWLPLLGLVGHTARGVVAGLIGIFLIQAALTHDPRRAVGIDGALRKLAGSPLGTAALVVVALGLLAYGLYSFVEARWRRILED